MGPLWLSLLLACALSDGQVPASSLRSEAPDAPATPIDVVGVVRGWDGTGDVAIEACGRGALVDDDGHGFMMRTATGCALRVVWERPGQRAVGAWHGLDEGEPVAAVADDGVPAVRLVLPMPEAATLRPLSDDEQRYREAVIREAQELLLQPVGEEGGGGASEGPGV